MILRKPYYLFFFVISLIFLTLDFRYAFHGWFIQDDFGFMWQYRDSFHWGDIIHRSPDFGRFITRNIYWHVLYNVWGKNAAAYFLVNLGFIVLNTLLLFYFLEKQFRDHFLALAGSVAYFVSFPVLENYGWISDSQHIIAHMFIVLFFMCAFSIRYRLWCIPLYILGIYANALMLFALPPVVVYWFFTKEYHKGIAAVLAIIAVTFLVLSMQMAAGPYKIDGSLATAFSNAHYYYGWVLGGLIVPFWLCVFYNAIQSNDGLLAFVVTAAVSFYLPFAFLKYQHAFNYFAMSYIFNMVIIFYYLKKWPWILLAIFLALSIQSYHKLSHMIAHPQGEDARRLVNRVQSLHLETGQTVCFRATKVTKNTTGVAVWNIPPFWWSVGFGDAFKLFVTPDNTYVLFSQHEKCDKIINV